MPYRSTRGRLSQSDTWLLELSWSIYTMIWGLGYLNPLTDVFVANPVSHHLLAALWRSEDLFGLAVTLLGAATVGAVISGHRQLRSWTFAVSAVFWLFIAIMIGVPTHWATGGVPHFILAAVVHWFCWTRLRYTGRVGTWTG